MCKNERREDDDEETDDDERRDWLALSLMGLQGAYADDEPEYPLSLLKAVNPDYGKAENAIMNYGGNGHGQDLDAGADG